MTQTVPTATATEATDAEVARPSPRRLTLVVLAGVILAMFVTMLATGSDIAHDSELADIVAAYGQSRLAMLLSSFAAMVLVGLLLFFGAALRSAVRGVQRSWLADVALLGFAGLGATIASWAVIDLATWKAVDFGDQSAIRTMATLSDAGFLPIMAAMIATYLGTGLAGLHTRALPKWLSVVAIGVGILAPLGPLGFIGMLLLPLFILATALTVRLDIAS